MKHPDNHFALRNLTIICIALLICGCTIEHKQLANNDSPNNAEQSETNVSAAVQPENRAKSESNPSEVNNLNGTVADSEIQENTPLEVLYDFRLIDRYTAPQKFTEREERLVLEYAFGANKGDPIFTGTVRQRINGAFTRAGSIQTLYLARGGEEPHNIIAIYDGTRPLGKIKFDGEEMLKTIDLDRDGRDELFVTTGDVYMSGRELTAQIIRLTESKVEVLKTFDKVCESADSLNHEKTLGEVAVISYASTTQPGAYPTRFVTKKYNCTGAQGALDPKTCRAK